MVPSFILLWVVHAPSQNANEEKEKIKVNNFQYLNLAHLKYQTSLPRIYKFYKNFLLFQSNIKYAYGIKL